MSHHLALSEDLLKFLIATGPKPSSDWTSITFLKMLKVNQRTHTPMKQASATLDLHGYKTEDIPDAVDRFLMNSQRKGLKRIRIMTGKGTGKVKKTVTDYLRQGGFPFSEERLPNGTKNEGVLVIFLDD